MAPSEPQNMINFLRDREAEHDMLQLEAVERDRRDKIRMANWSYPHMKKAISVSAHVPVGLWLLSCLHILYYSVRRGAERSPPRW